MAPGEPFLAGAHLRADLGPDHHLVPAAAPLEPVADDGLGFAALVAGHPGRISIRRIDEVEAGANEPIEQIEGPRLVGRPAEDVAAEAERGDSQVGTTQRTQFHHPLRSGYRVVRHRLTAVGRGVYSAL
jgi:hypothetical protein